MGGSSKKQTIGYKYYLGMHMILCHGPADFLRRIEVDKKTAVDGIYGHGRVNVDKPNLFGGEKREGGVGGIEVVSNPFTGELYSSTNVGEVDLEFGEPDQIKNDYLQERLGDDIPAFKGVVGVVLRQIYLGVNPYLKRWSFRIQRINKTGSDGQDQWYKEKAAIGSFADTSIYFALDTSNSMNTVTGNGESRLHNMKIAINEVLEYFKGLVEIGVNLDVHVTGWNASHQSDEYFDVNDSNLNTLQTFVTNLGTNITTDFSEAFEEAEDFFNNSSYSNRIVIFVTDGLPSPEAGPPEDQLNNAEAGALLINAIPNLQIYGFNIEQTNLTYTELIDNTSYDGIPIVAGDNSNQLLSSILGSIASHFDMNPAHIIRECLTNLDWGMGYQESDIDDTSFTIAADTLFSEEIGVSILWDRQNQIENFIAEITKHIDASLYIDRTTGKFVLSLIRADYNVGDLITLDESNINRVENLKKASFEELSNSVTVNYWDQQTGENASLTVQDTALSMMQQASINTTIQYPGFSNGNVAGRIAARDLKALSSALWSGVIYANQTADVLNIGSVFKFSWPDYGIENLVMRVTGLSFGDSKSNRVKIICSEDVFSTPEESIISIPDFEDGWTPIDNTPESLTVRMLEEAPYYELVTLLGQTSVDSNLENNPDLGYFVISAGRPAAEGATNASTYVDSGSGTYLDSDILDFSPFGYLAEDIDEKTITFDIENLEDLSSISIGQHCQIDDELCRVDSISSISITVGRAVLDTSPRKHLTGALIMFWDNFPSSDETEYVSSESINVKLLTATGQGILEEASAAVDSLTFDSRAIRPYPPGNLEVDLVPYPDPFEVTSPVTLSWAHRDRLQQTSGVFYDHEDGSIGPEAGTTYQVRADSYDDGGVLITGDWLDTNVGTNTTWEFDPGVSTPPANTAKVIFKIYSLRDGYESKTYPHQELLISFEIDLTNAWWSYDGATLPNYSVLASSTYYDSDQDTTWIVTEAWHGNGRDEIVEGLRHATGLTTVRGRAFQSSEDDDDHGISAIIVDDDGYLHVVGGAHVDTFEYSISSSANDCSSWNAQTSSFTNGTYPKLSKKADGTLILYYRKNLDELVLFQTTSVGSGSATWGSEIKIWDRANGARIYPTTSFIDGDDIWILALKANTANSQRHNLYVFVYDTVTGDLKNHNDTTTVSSGSLPINDTTADADFKVVDWSNTLVGWYPDMFLDSTGVVHCVWIRENLSGTYDVYHMYKATLATASFTTPEIIATNNYPNGSAVLVEYNSTTIRCWFIEDEDDDFATNSEGGNLHYVERSGTTWGTAQRFYAPSTSRYGFHRPQRIINGDNDAKFLVSETTAGSDDSVAGGLKTHIFNSTHSPVTRTKVLTSTYTTLIAALAGSYGAGRLIAIDQLINNLNDSGVLAKLDALYLMNALTEDDAKINWIDPGTFDLTYTGSPVFTADQGIATNVPTSHIDTNFNPSTAGGNYSQNSASFGFWCLLDNTGSGTGGRLSSGNGVFINAYSGTQMSGRINHSSSGNNMSSSVPLNSIGLSSIDRDGASSSSMYKSGEKLTTQTRASEPLVSGNLLLGGTSSSTRAQEFAASWIGASLSEDEHLLMQILIGSYLIGVDKNSI